MIGDWWTPLILRDATRGITRFDEFQTSLGLSRNTLTQRLEKLVAEGLMEKVPYCEKPKRYNYVLTQMGWEFFPVLLAMTRWGDKWLFDGKSPFKLRHTTCGHETTGVIVCTQCGEPLDPAHMEHV